MRPQIFTIQVISICHMSAKRLTFLCKFYQWQKTTNLASIRLTLQLIFQTSSVWNLNWNNDSVRRGFIAALPLPLLKRKTKNKNDRSTCPTTQTRTRTNRSAQPNSGICRASIAVVYNPWLVAGYYRNPDLYYLVGFAKVKGSLYRN